MRKGQPSSPHIYSSSLLAFDLLKFLGFRVFGFFLLPVRVDQYYRPSQNKTSVNILINIFGNDF